MEKLPFDIFEEIGQYLHTTNLANLAISHRNFRYIFNKNYIKISISDIYINTKHYIAWRL